jgi:hypothetical protein
LNPPTENYSKNIRFIIPKNYIKTMKLNYVFEKFINWKQIDSIELERKLENETAFDGIVKIYSLKSNRNELNEILKNKYFGDFFFESQNGIFLRMFDNKNSWPNTTLIYINLNNSKLTEIKKTNSSWNDWFGKDLGNGNYSIEIQPTEKIEFKITE